ncbi:MAG: GNAT family N-acetyltransferase [Pseudomonadota bacterium]
MTIRLREARADERPVINALIERAVRTWDLPERVLRLSVPLYQYDPVAFDELIAVVAVDEADGPVGVATWEPAAPADCPEGSEALLLHGIYVEPEQSRRGIGRALFEACREAARAAGRDGVLVKAQGDAAPFFEALGLERLPVVDTDRDYARRYWLPVA